jgi:hypothetical protein
VGRREGSAHL